MNQIITNAQSVERMLVIVQVLFSSFVPHPRFRFLKSFPLSLLFEKGYPLPGRPQWLHFAFPGCYFIYLLSIRFTDGAKERTTAARQTDFSEMKSFLSEPTLFNRDLFRWMVKIWKTATVDYSGKLKAELNGSTVADTKRADCWCVVLFDCN